MLLCNGILRGREVTYKIMFSVSSNFSKTQIELSTFSEDWTHTHSPLTMAMPLHMLISGHGHNITNAYYLYIFITAGHSNPYAYHWPWSKYCLSSSIGGCAPYISLAGMFISSTNITHLMFFGGPYKPFLRLCNFEMTSS